MVRLLSLATLLACALTAQACTYCQCLFRDGSHCCVYSDAEVGNMDCNAVCGGAHRADGVYNKNDPLHPGTGCNAGGKYTCVGAWNAQFRTPCYKQ